MSFVLHVSDLRVPDRCRVGGTAHSLAQLGADGLHVPDTLCVTTTAYEVFVQASGLDERIQIELGRKDFSDMRWQEIRDASLRIRHLFARTLATAR